MPFFIPFLIVAGVVALSSRGKGEPDLDDVITLVGPTSAGKSLLGNDLLGTHAFGVDASHGTTREVRSAVFTNGWRIADTPGILDGEALATIALTQAQRSRVIVVCVDGEMYRQTREWLERYFASCTKTKKVCVIPYLTKSDLRRKTMTTRDASKVESAIRGQFEEIARKLDRVNISISPLLVGEPGDRFTLRRALQSAMKSTKL